MEWDRLAYVTASILLLSLISFVVYIKVDQLEQKQKYYDDKNIDWEYDHGIAFGERLTMEYVQGIKDGYRGNYTRWCNIVERYNASEEIQAKNPQLYSAIC